VRRLSNVRKNAPSCREQGIAISPTTKKEIHPSIVPEYPHVIYISHNKNLRSAVRELGTGDAFRLMASTFWRPNLDTITFSFAPGLKVVGVAIARWERKLVHDRNPVFNWPMPQDAA
jgi:hypothetical protein